MFTGLPATMSGLAAAAASTTPSALRSLSTAATNANPPKAIKKLVVFGSGLMGSGIVQSAAVKNINVTMVDVDAAATERGKGLISASLKRVAKKAHPEDAGAQAAMVDKTMSLIKTSTDGSQAVADADLVIEAIVENLGVKQKLFKQLDAAAPSHTIFASNTSSLRITDIAATVSSNRLSQFGGLHMFNPPAVMKLVEVISTDYTSPNTHKALVAFVKALGKVPVDCKDTPGFIVNRLLVPYIFEAVRLVERGDASYPDVDVAMKLGSGVPMGPFELADYIGLDTLKFIMDGWYKHGEGIKGTELMKPSPMLDDLIAEGSLGRKNGRGFYNYEGGGKELVPNAGSAALKKHLK